MLSFKTISSFIATGIVAQLAAAVAGLLLVRWMSVGDYAIYTVATTMIGAIAMITRGGVQLGLSAALSRVWPDRALAAAAVAAANTVRLLVSALTMPGIIAMAWYLLVRAGADSGTVAVVLVLLAAVWFADLRSSVIDQALNFAGLAIRVQALDSAIAVGRAVLIVGLWLGNAVSVTAALITNLLAAVARVPVIQRWLDRLFAGQHAQPDPADQAQLRTIALRQIPVDLFTGLQAPITLYLLTRSGASIELATYGALARITHVLTPFNAVGLAYFVPAFAKVRSHVPATIVGYVLLGSVPGLALLAWALAAPETLLFLIGPQYAGQAQALAVCAATIAVMSAVHIAWTLVAHRGWNRWGWVRIAFGAAWCVVGPLVIAVDTAAGGYIFYCGFAFGTLLALILELGSASKSGEIALRAPSE